MVRRLVFCTVALSLILFVLGSCGQDKKKADEKNAITVEELDNTPDEAELVEVYKVASDSIYGTLVGDIGERVYCLKGDTKVEGSLNVGDTLSIFPENKTRSAKICINVSELKGQWFYDMQQHRGLSFTIPRRSGKNGGMASINTTDFAFKEWKLLNGKLYLCYVDIQQVAKERTEYQVEEAEITYLDKERLEFNFHNQKYSCRRQHGLLTF